MTRGRQRKIILITSRIHQNPKSRVHQIQKSTNKLNPQGDTPRRRKHHPRANRKRRSLVDRRLLELYHSEKPFHQHVGQ